jgi:hypothetical protein
MIEADPRTIPERAERVRALATPLAAAWAAGALRSTSVGVERAVLRSFGVAGLARDGRPLAWSVVDRWLASDRSALGSGVALGFALAMLEYDQGPQRIALDIASGAVELAMEARLLDESDRRATAEMEARRLAQTALERIDAQRTARHELLAVLGDARRPWLGAETREPLANAAAAEAAGLARAGVDVVRVAVPSGRELVDRLLDLGLDIPGPVPFGQSGGTAEDEASAPAGSQRGLARLRSTLDEAAAERGAYVRLATTAPALSAPEQAVVAATERIDMAAADPFAEVVEGGVDPDRALIDHVFAHRLYARAGTTLLLGPGPVVVAPDLERGTAPRPEDLAGRALALQLLAAELAVAAGMAPGAVAIGALPEQPLLGRPAASRALADIVVRSAVLPEHPLALVAPSPDESAGGSRVRATWERVVDAALAWGLDIELVLRPDRTSAEEAVGPGAVATGGHLAAIDVADARREAEDRSGTPVLYGEAAAHATAMLDAAERTLLGLRDEGWRSVLGEAPVQGRPRGIGADAIAERTDAFDPYA